jgi:hypothetical protein
MRYLKTYKLFENNQQTIDEFFSVMQGTPEGTDFMKWFVADPKRTGRIYITTKNGTGVYIPSITYFDKVSSGQWSYKYVSSGNMYGEQYGDLKSLFRRIIIDSIIKNIPVGVKRAEIEEFFYKNPIIPGTLPDKLQPLIDLFIQSERGGLIKDLGFLKDIPWIKMMIDLGIYTTGSLDSGQFSIRRGNIDKIMGISSELEELLSTMGIRFYFYCNIGLMRFIPGPKGRKRQKTKDSSYGGMRYDFYLGYETEEEIINIAEKDINKCLSELDCEAAFKENWSSNIPVSFMKENLESLIKYGKLLPDYNEHFNNFIADIIGERIQKDYSKIALLKNHEGIVEILREKRPDIFGASKEATKDLIKGVSALKRFGTFDND